MRDGKSASIHPLPEPGRDKRIRELEAAFQNDYRSVQYIFVEFISEHLADCSRVFAGDLQEMLVLAIVGQSYLGSQPGVARNSISASRIADIMGIPRQTVRRKLLQLSEKNWIEQLADQTWSIKSDGDRSVARKVLGDLDRRGVLRAAKLFAQLESRLRDEKLPAEPPIT